MSINKRAAFRATWFVTKSVLTGLSPFVFGYFFGSNGILAFLVLLGVLSIWGIAHVWKSVYHMEARKP